MINCIFDNMPTRHVKLFTWRQKTESKILRMHCVLLSFYKKCVFFAIQCNDNVSGVIPVFIPFY